jgi:alkylation response protein AidB-like acyl-CoA dehydrogenase
LTVAVLTEEQTILRDAAREWTAEKSPVAALRKVRDSKAPLGYDPALWAEMGEMGWAGVIVPEAYGGSEFGYLGLGLILEETGKTLTASPLLSTALAGASALVLGGSEAQKAEWLPKIAAGEVVVSLAVDEGAHHAPEKTAMTAIKSGAGYRLNGAKTFVIEGMAADLFVVAARTGGQPGETDGVELFLAPATAKGVSRTALRLADSRGHAMVDFDHVEIPAGNLLAGGWGTVEGVLDRARAGLAAEMLGASVQAFQITLDYLKTRRQFGQLIGSFQGLQHRAAKMFSEIELTRSAVEAALAAIDNKANNIAEMASLAKTRAGDTLHLVSNEMVQMHGGIGMTDEADAGLYLKRARVAEAAFGGQTYHRDRYAKLSGY